MPVELRRVPLHDFGAADEPPEIPSAEYEARAAALTQAVGADWVAVYGDREHGANLLFLSGFDPRFEEALLLLGPNERRVLVVGNEGVIHAAVARLPVEVVLYQGFSLLGQPRDEAPRLDVVLREAGLEPGQRVGVAGWKYFDATETDDPTAPAFVPALLVDALRRVAGEDLVDATPALMHRSTDCGRGPPPRRSPPSSGPRGGPARRCYGSSAARSRGRRSGRRRA